MVETGFREAPLTWVTIDMDPGRCTTRTTRARRPAGRRTWFSLLSPHTRPVGLFALTLLVFLLGSGSAQAFTDVQPSRLDYAAITGLAVKGAVQGFGDGAFQPDSPALRAEFVKMVTAAMFLPTRDPREAPFEDSDLGGTLAPYPGGYVAAAYVAGIVKGKSATVFDPYGPLTRAQAMTIAVRAAERLRAGDFKPLPAGYQGTFSNFNDPAHGENARLAEANHLLAGIDLLRWNPWDTASRSEAATIVWNLVGCFG
jgi:hypothetical protein